MTAYALIREERARQKKEMGFTAKHDDGHTRGQLALAGAVWALPLELREQMVMDRPLRRWLYPINWTFGGIVRIQSTEQSRSSRLRELVKAGALIVAEIERLQRVAR